MTLRELCSFLYEDGFDLNKINLHDIEIYDGGAKITLINESNSKHYIFYELRIPSGERLVSLYYRETEDDDYEEMHTRLYKKDEKIDWLLFCLTTLVHNNHCGGHWCNTCPKDCKRD